MGSGDSSTTVKDLAIFESRLGLPTVAVTVTDIPRDGDFSDTSGNVEWELDAQSSTGPKQANASFGACETSPANATLESTIPAAERRTRA